jgi:hypothetical protein
MAATAAAGGSYAPGRSDSRGRQRAAALLGEAAGAITLLGEAAAATAAATFEGEAQLSDNRQSYVGCLEHPKKMTAA